MCVSEGKKKRRLKTLLGSKRKSKYLVNKSLIIKTMDTVVLKKRLIDEYFKKGVSRSRVQRIESMCRNLSAGNN